MSMQFVKASQLHFEAVCALYQQAIEGMHARGMKQWDWEIYPSRAILESDLEKQQLYIAEADGALKGAFVLCGEMEEEYSRMEWHYGVKPATLHRLAMLPEVYSAETVRGILVFVHEEAVRLGFDSLRMDVCCEDEA